MQSGGIAHKTHTARTRTACGAIATGAGSSAACTTAATISAARVDMLGLINGERTVAGAAPLHLDRRLDAIAQARSQDMIDRDYFSHQIPGAGTVFDILNRDHIPYTSAGENIAMNSYITVYSLAQTMRRTNADFMHSPIHRANILCRQYTDLGLGIAFQRASGKLILTEVFTQP
jgi:uncharacterized protein YkwD